MWLSDTQKIGVGLTAFGIIMMVLGILLFFDGGLLAIGNILFLSGITLIIGFKKTIIFFFARKDKIRGTIFFFGGIILLVFVKMPFLGMIVEFFGFLNLFGDFFPVIIRFSRQLPIIGTILCAPYISNVVDKLAGSKLPV
ncbi:12181_t:CDS:2 [Funneliformis caledonium]|uniref:12181_t:CDS:1 n=2 Tax=Funneliformis TaxID=1117308 RepID=A0A9N9EZY2_9GLOM|nr:9268_t:CDS:2 [Funneliformis mosseae]CAG8500896.1 12181_t:CDS:2 [Funneliformis caledonium]